MIVGKRATRRASRFEVDSAGDVGRLTRPSPRRGYRPRSPIGLPSASASTQIRVSDATWRGALRSVAPAASRVSRVASRSSTSAKATRSGVLATRIQGDFEAVHVVPDVVRLVGVRCAEQRGVDRLGGVQVGYRDHQAADCGTHIRLPRGTRSSTTASSAIRTTLSAPQGRRFSNPDRAVWVWSVVTDRRAQVPDPDSRWVRRPQTSLFVPCVPSLGWSTSSFGGTEPARTCIRRPCFSDAVSPMGTLTTPGGPGPRRSAVRPSRADPIHGRWWTREPRLSRCSLRF